LSKNNKGFDNITQKSREI